MVFTEHNILRRVGQIVRKAVDKVASSDDNQLVKIHRVSGICEVENLLFDEFGEAYDNACDNEFSPEAEDNPTT